MSGYCLRSGSNYHLQSSISLWKSNGLWSFLLKIYLKKNQWPRVKRTEVHLPVRQEERRNVQIKFQMEKIKFDDVMYSPQSSQRMNHSN